MKSKFLTLFCSIKRTIFHLIITLIFGIILILSSVFAPTQITINNLLIGLVSGLAASYLIAIYEILRINKKARNKISCILALFTEYVSICINFDFMELYKLYIELCSSSQDLCYKSNFDNISNDIYNILKLIKDKKSISELDCCLKKLKINISNF